jgi:hypothetical protein
MNGNLVFGPIALYTATMQACAAVQEIYFKPHMWFVLGARPAQCAVVAMMMFFPSPDLRHERKSIGRGG